MSRVACEVALEAIEGHFHRLGVPVLEYLKPGLTDAEMDELTEPFGFRLPEDVRAWWSWHNGALERDEVLSASRGAFEPSHRWLSFGGGPMASLDRALAHRVQLLEAERQYKQQWGGEDMLPLWTPFWLALTTFKDSWAVDMGHDYSASRVFVSDPQGGYPPRADTLQEFLERWLGFLDEGLIVWRWDSGGSWDLDNDATADRVWAAFRGL